ncbi:hypothetical protein LJC74_03405 [Eubacteriales bacterium OttesenSCG-928-A19]|nr:hypothetical protein [Eubacteriales bacterium OttesenSCG-928-A19]
MDEEKVLPEAAGPPIEKPTPISIATPTLQPQKLGEGSGFYLLAQSRATNSLAHKLTTRFAGPAQLDLLGNATVNSKDFRLFIRGYTELTNGINTSAAKLLDSLLITATTNGLSDTLVTLPLKEYMAMRGLRDVKSARQQVRRDIDALERVRFEYLGIGKDRGSWLNVTLAGGTSGIKNGVIYFRFNEDFYNSVRVSEGRYLFMFFPRESLRLNDNVNPYSYAFARRIAEHKRINLGRVNENSIRVATILRACPAFPTYAEVMAGNRNVTDRIIAPFERDMNALRDAFTWEYAGEPPQSYQAFIEATVRIHWAGYPDVDRLRAARAKRRKKRGE